MKLKKVVLTFAAGLALQAGIYYYLDNVLLRLHRTIRLTERISRKPWDSVSSRTGRHTILLINGLWPPS